jgi:hypothetical protein
MLGKKILNKAKNNNKRDLNQMKIIIINQLEKILWISNNCSSPYFKTFSYLDEYEILTLYLLKFSIKIYINSIQQLNWKLYLLI